MIRLKPLLISFCLNVTIMRVWNFGLQLDSSSVTPLVWTTGPGMSECRSYLQSMNDVMVWISTWIWLKEWALETCIMNGSIPTLLSVNLPGNKKVRKILDQGPTPKERNGLLLLLTKGFPGWKSV